MDGNCTRCTSSESLLTAVDSEQHFSLQRTITAPILVELRLSLPSIAKELDCDPAELYISDRIFACRDSHKEGISDVPYKAIGHDVVPFIAHTGLHHGPNPGWGIFFFKNKLDHSIRYAIYAQQGQWGDNQFLVCKKGEVFRLARNANRQRKEAVKVLVPPVLAPGVLTAALESTIGFMQKGKEISKYGVRVRHGLLLTGTPGNGKTMLCRHLQHLADRYSYGWGVITSSEIDKAYTEGSLHGIFGRYPFTFFDDIDVAYLHREKSKGAIACAILAAMDGVIDIPAHHLVRVFTTNEDVSAMDPAFTRPGRIDRIIRIDKPDREMRAQLVASWHDEIVAHMDVDEFLEATEGMSFADVEGIKTHFVTARVVRGDDWDMERAVEEFIERRAESATYKFHGFDGTGRRLKKKKALELATSAATPKLVGFNIKPPTQK